MSVMDWYEGPPTTNPTDRERVAALVARYWRYLGHITIGWVLGLLPVILIAWVGPGSAADSIPLYLTRYGFAYLCAAGLGLIVWAFVDDVRDRLPRRNA